MKGFVIGLLLLLSKPLLAQETLFLEEPIQVITIPDLDLVSFDTKDQLFISSKNGDIYQFNSAGKSINRYSPERQGRLQQLEASWTVNIFSFSADLQEYRILDRFLNPLASKGFQFSDISLAKAATLGNNNIIWVWDESDLSLKTLDYLRNLVTQSQPLNLILNSSKLEVLEIREFKNRLFMNVAEEGIFMFDNQGNFLQKIDLKARQKLCFYREHLIWVENDHIQAISISSKQISTLGKLAFTESVSLQIGQDRMALITTSSVHLVPIPEAIKALR